MQFKPEDQELSFIKWNWSCVLSPSVSNYPVITFSLLYSSFNVSSIIRSIPTIPVTKWQFLLLTNTKVSKVFPNKKDWSNTELFYITYKKIWNYNLLTMKKIKGKVWDKIIKWRIHVKKKVNIPQDTSLLPRY